MTIKFTGVECDNASEAVSYSDADGSEAISAFGGYFAVREAEAERLTSLGVELAYLFDHEMPNGTRRILSVPVN